MDSPSRSRKRGSEDQLDKQVENSEPENTKRSKASLESILERIPASDLNFTGKTPRLAGFSDDRALYMPDSHVDLREQQNGKRSMINSQSRREGEELPGTIVHESIVRQDSQTPVNGSTGQGSIANYDDMFVIPILPRQEDQGIALAREPDRLVSGMNHNSLPNFPGGGGSNHALQDYQMQVILLEQRNKKKLLMARQAQEDQGTALWSITSLPDRLNIAHNSVKELLENLPAHFRIIEAFKASIPADINALQSCEVNLDKKEAEIKALGNEYDELIEKTPITHKGELWDVKDKAMLTMQQDLEKVKMERDNITRVVGEKNRRIAEVEAALGRARELMPELIQNLRELAPKLRNGQF